MKNIVCALVRSLVIDLAAPVHPSAIGIQRGRIVHASFSCIDASTDSNRCLIVPLGMRAVPCIVVRLLTLPPCVSLAITSLCLCFIVLFTSANALALLTDILSLLPCPFFFNVMIWL